ncbi:MAG: ABC transporter ATP-binding protein [Pseudomonadota bacterium]
MAALIRLSGVTKIYGQGERRVVALDGVDLDIAPGEFLVIKGKSGCGKTTLLAVMGALEVPTRGRVSAFGRDLAGLSERDLSRYRRERVGTVFQSFNLIPVLDVAENVALPLLLNGTSTSEARGRAWALLDDVGLTARAHHLPHELSGGEAQRTAIARALVCDPPLIIADEPTGNLDSRTGGNIIALLADLARRRARTVVLATHGQDIDAVASRVLIMHDGRIQGSS